MKMLHEDKPSDAIPAALQSLRCAESLYGRYSVHLVPPFLMLAEACVGLYCKHPFITMTEPISAATAL